MAGRLQRVVADYSGARAELISDVGGHHVSEHSHDWPVLSLFVMGAYRNESDLGETSVAGPSAMFYSARERHSNDIGVHGLEQVDIEFDPDWLDFRHDRFPVRCWQGGATAAAARTLAKLWKSSAATEAQRREATKQFLSRAFDVAAPPRPRWLSQVLESLDPAAPVPTRSIARELDLNASWLAEAYRASAGEGIGDTLRRRRVELAAHLLRTSDQASAHVAVAAGFCDQSHMIRAFKAVVGRTPLQVRREWSATRPG